ncbi:hypothetical protein [Propionibacterium acidifaciens]|uniref:hypothetical protein n=1 Tax=Propionibacterium acidifaciens TaxID=556499 RepID=UPI0023F106AF|nr:hypothetical protein [Propionibacterium acidifaciens]
MLVLVCWLGAVGAELLVLCDAFGAALVGAELEGAVSDGVALELEEVVLEGAALGVAVPEGVLVACWSADVLSSELALVEVLDDAVLEDAAQVGALELEDAVQGVSGVAFEADGDVLEDAVQVGALGVALGLEDVVQGVSGVALEADGDVLGEAVQVGVLGVSEGANVSSGWEGVGHWHWHGRCSWHAGLAGPVAA